MSNAQQPDDATLVAWLDGELPQETANDVAKAVHADADLGERVRLLRSARAELAWACNESASAPPPAPLAQPPARANFGKWLLVAAALTIVATIGYWQPAENAAAAENDVLAIKLTSPRASWDFFSDIRFAIEGHAKTDIPCHIVARERNETDAQMVERALTENGGKAIIPMALTATLSIGKRDLPGIVPAIEGTFGREPSSVAIRLPDVRVKNEAIGPLLTFEPKDGGSREDFMWPFRKAIRPHAGGELGFVPTEIGEYRIRFQLRALARPGAEPAFAEPLEVAIGFGVRGIVGDWSEPVDGMRARVVVSRNQVAGKPLEVGLQLRNDSDRPRKYNVYGTTIAKIPQPFHFDIVIDGETWQQRDDLGVFMTGRSTFLDQPVGSTRSVIVLDKYWRHPKKPATKLRGQHKISIKVDTRPSLWDSNDKGFWIGKVDTPPVEVTF